MDMQTIYYADYKINYKAYVVQSYVSQHAATNPGQPAWMFIGRALLPEVCLAWENSLISSMTSRTH